MAEPGEVTPALPSAETRWTALAAIAQPHGVRGLCKLKFLHTQAQQLLFSGLPISDAQGIAYQLRPAGNSKGMMLAALEGVHSRTQIELLRGTVLGAQLAAAEPLASPHTYYVQDLLGLRATQPDGSPYGEVIQVDNFGASDILTIRQTSGAVQAFAFTHRTFPEVDPAQGRLVIAPPEDWSGSEEN